MTFSMVLQRTSGSVLRLVGLLHQHRWDVEQLIVEPDDTFGVQRIRLRICVEGLVPHRVVSVLHQLIEVIDVKVLDNAA